MARNILQKLPNCHLCYAADNAMFPYGQLSDSVLIARVVDQIDALIAAQKPDIVVIACNTASTLALEELRRRFDTPFVGVVPAIKPAAKLSSSGAIGLLATPATVNRLYTQQLIEDFASGLEVFLYGSQALVTLAEHYIAGEEIDSKALNHEINQLYSCPKAEQIDTIVLACTHFPILKPLLSEHKSPKGRSIQWIDSGDAIARRVASLVETDEGFRQRSAPPQTVREPSKDKAGDEYSAPVEIYLSQVSAKDHTLKQRYIHFLTRST